MEYFIKYLERKIEACDELGGLGREKAVYQSVLKDYKKAINVIQCCKSDSEQLTCDTCKHNCLVWDDEHPCATCAGLDNYVAR
jgi:hypothetical protein